MAIARSAEQKNVLQVVPGTKQEENKKVPGYVSELPTLGS